MKPFFTDETKYGTIRDFITARIEREFEILSFKTVANHLNAKNINLLAKLEPSGFDEWHDTYGTYHKKIYFTDKDGERYFEWLVRVVSGTAKDSDHLIKEAINQLFLFVTTLGNNLRRNKKIRLVAPYNWEERLVSFEKELGSIKNNLENRDEKITHILDQIFEWLKQYRPILDEVQKDYGDK
jgi:hypothetical protein